MLASPNFPAAYPHNSHCLWFLDFAPGSQVQIVVLYWYCRLLGSDPADRHQLLAGERLPGGQRDGAALLCPELLCTAVLQVRAGGYLTSPVLWTGCGNTVPPVLLSQVESSLYCVLVCIVLCSPAGSVWSSCLTGSTRPPGSASPRWNTPPAAGASCMVRWDRTARKLLCLLTMRCRVVRYEPRLPRGGPATRPGRSACGRSAPTRATTSRSPSPAGSTSSSVQTATRTTFR